MGYRLYALCSIPTYALLNFFVKRLRLRKVKRLRLSGTRKKKFHVGKGKCLRMSCEREMSVWSMEISANLLLHCSTYLAL